MRNKYEMMIHFANGVNPLKVAKNLLESWEKSNRDQLYIFRKTGEGVIPTENMLEQALDIGEREYVSVTFKSSRKRDADKVELYFSNPSWNMIQTNVCTISFHKSKIETCNKGYSIEELIDLLDNIVKSGLAIRGFVEADDIRYDEQVWRIEESFSEVRDEYVWPFLICWLTYIPIDGIEAIGGIERIEELGLQVMKMNSDGGCIVWTKDYPFPDYKLHMAKLIEINSAISLIG